MSYSPFLPIIIGTDMNAYNMAISFHEAYQMKPILVGREPMPFTSLSKVIERIEFYPMLADPGQFAPILIQVASALQSMNKKLLLVGTNDLYVRLMIENKDALSPYYVFNAINEALINRLQIKSNFYKLCEQYGIDTPITYMYHCGEGEGVGDREAFAPFFDQLAYPVIVKPSDSIAYYEHKFHGQQKVYKVMSEEELRGVIRKIKASGYREELIIQDYIPGNDTYMWDSVIYVSSAGKTQLVTFAQVVLQERAATAIGNYTAVITRYNEEMMKKLQHFLEAIGYCGFANFDLKYDPRDGKFKVFEVNVRQGRSSYYVTALGHNMAEYLVDDMIYGKEKPLTYLDKEYLFTVVPKLVLRKFVENDAIRADVIRIIKEEKYGNPLFYKKDASFRRKLYLLVRQANYYRKYTRNKW